MMFARFKEMLSRNAMLAQVDAMPDQALSDLGVSRAQMSQLARIPDMVPTRMARMADLFGADFRRLERDRSTYLDAVQACHSCGAAKSCSKALARSDADPAAPQDLGFCANAGLYTDMATPRG
jgi:hypothetical protein